MDGPFFVTATFLPAAVFGNLLIVNHLSKVPGYLSTWVLCLND